jgi:hypothetical protein
MNLKHELQSIISGIGDHSAEDLIKAAAHYIRESQKTSGNPEKSEFSKKQEAKKLIEWIETENLWFHNHDENRFIASGAEQRVYLHSNEKFVYKFNGTIFYEFWLDYFYSLFIHNYFFPQTAYELIGFYQENEILYSVVKQPFIEISEPTNLPSVKEFLNQNGFELKKNNDYFNNKIGIILEDLHDENVLTNNGVLFFIDTVFYIKDSFFSEE